MLESSLYRNGAIVNAHDGILAGRELESDAELLAMGGLSKRDTAMFEGQELDPIYPEPEPTYFTRTLLADWLDSAGDDTVWHLPYVAAAGAITLLTGGPKAGKSQLIWGMLSEALRQNTALGDPVVPGLTVHILTEERPASLMKMVRRVGLADYLPRGDDPPQWFVTGYHDLNNHDWATMIDHAAATWQLAGESPDLLVVDTLGHWAGSGDGKSVDWNDYGQVVGKLAPLSRLSGIFPHMAIVLIHHSRKSGGDTIESALGSAGLTGAVDNIVAIDEPEGGDKFTRRLRFAGRIEPEGAGVGVGEKWVRWDSTTGLYSYAKRNEAVELLVTEILDDADGPQTPQQIFDAIPADIAKASLPTIRLLCKNGYDHGTFLREKAGKGFAYWLSGAKPTIYLEEAS